MRAIAMLVALVWLPATAAASECRDRLRAHGVDAEPVKRAHIEDAVRVRGALGGVAFKPYTMRELVIDCSLALALERSGRFFREHGVIAAVYSSAYSRRRMRKSGRWSLHAVGKAIDIHRFELADGTVLELADNYEQGLGHEADCVGSPLTREGAILRALSCQLTRSGHFYNVLDPDYDAHHFNHFHLDVHR